MRKDKRQSRKMALKTLSDLNKIVIDAIDSDRSFIVSFYAEKDSENYYFGEVSNCYNSDWIRLIAREIVDLASASETSISKVMEVIPIYILEIAQNGSRPLTQKEENELSNRPTN